MNKTYRSIWNTATSTWTAVAETAKSHSKGSSRAARQAVIAIALGGAVIGSAAAAEVCTAADGSSGTLDDAGVCQTVNQSEIGAMGSIGTMAGGWSSGNGISIVTGAGATANAATASDIAIGNGSSAIGGTSTALGNGATVGTSAGTAIGANATSTASYGLAIGAATRAGRGAVVEATGSVAIGTISHVTSDANSAVALGMGSVAHEANTVSVGAGVPNIDGATFTRRIVNVSDGMADTDAATVGQMNTGLSTTNASITATNAALSTTNTTLAATNTALSTTNTTLAATNSALSTTNTQVAALGTDMATAKREIATHTTEIATINDQLAGLSDGSIGLVQQSAAGADLTVGASTDGAAVNFAGTAGDRKLSGVAEGVLDSDAVNVGQMNAGLSTTNAAIAATNAELSTTNTTLAATNTTLSTTNTRVAALDADMTTAKDTIATHTTDIATINDQLAGLSDGSIGLVQQSAAGADLTVGANTDGAAVNFAGTAGDRQLSGIAAGTAESDAVNVGQMNAGLSTANARIDATNTELSTTNTALAATNVDLSSAQGTIATHTTEISNINDQLSELSSGTIGLVQQSAAGADLTVGANTDGAAVNFAGTAGDRKLTGIADGTLDSDAVNVGQMNTGLTAANARIDATNTELSTAQGTIATHTTEISEINNQLSELSGGTIGLVQQSAAGADLTVGASTDGTAVNFAGTAGDRKLTGLAAGDVSVTSTEAVNGAQLHGVADSVASAIGGDSIVNPDGSISAPSFKVGDGSGGTITVGSVAGAVSNLDGRTTANEGEIGKLSEQIGSGTVGLVQQAGAGADLTVGAATNGAAVNFAGTAGDRKLTGIAAGDVSAASHEAVNGAQLHGVANSVASAIGGDSIVNPDGSISAPKFTVGDGSGGTKIVHSVGDVVTNIDERVTNNEGSIKDIAEQLGSGTVGLVQQASAGDDITVGANTGGAAVNFAGTAGNRKLTGIEAGTDASDAVNVGQMNAGLSTANARIDATNAELSTTNSTLSATNTALSTAQGTIATHTTEITNINNQLSGLSDGTLGLVQQNPTSSTITVGAGTGGSVVNFAGTDGPRVLAGVKNGEDDDDVVTVSQLRATGLIDYTGKEVGAVTYDSGLSFDSVTFAGTNGTVLRQVAAGLVDRGSMEAVNGGQLFDLQEQFAKQFGELSGQVGNLSDRFDDLAGRLGDLEENPGTGGPGTGGGSTVVGEGAVASGENSSAIGDSALASGENSSAVGQGSVASGSNGSAIGQGSVASGDNGSALGQGAVASGENGTALGQGSAASGSNGTAVGQGAVASGDNSTSLGQGAVASGSNSVAIGQGSVATEANTVSFGDGTAEGNRRLVNIADGINASDAATKGQLDRAMESVDQRFNDTNRAINDVAKNAYAGIAAAMAMPNMTPSQPGKTVVAVGAANFKSGSAIAAGATYRSRNGNWLVNGATSVTSVGDVGVRAQVGYEF